MTWPSNGAALVTGHRTSRELTDRAPGQGPAIHRDQDAGDLGRSLAGQEEDGLRHIARRAPTLERLVELNGGTQVVVRDPRRDVAGGDAIDPDAIFGQVGGESEPH